ncbi:MAG: type I 3-dehydroquinate dehydratase [Chloroflexota bacterium]|nr:MAG: type I 3-dehydroquinate dehydratase [Chloroflexota bacterium]
MPRGASRIAVALPSPDLGAAGTAGVDLAEVRLDLFEWPVDVARMLAGQRPRVIATNRPPREGGQSPLGEADRIEALREAAAAGAEFIDLEWDVADFAVVARDLRASGARVIVSRHDFGGMPDLAAWARAIDAAEPDIVKVVGTAIDSVDGATPLRVLAEAKRPTIAIAMGPLGLATRVMALAYERCFLTFAALPGGGTAPGQIDLTAMREMYRADTIDETTRFILVDPAVVAEDAIGIANRRFAATGISRRMVPWSIEAASAIVVARALDNLPVDAVLARVGDGAIRRSGGWRAAGDPTIEGVINSLH